MNIITTMEPSGYSCWMLETLLSAIALFIWPCQAALSGLVSLFIPTSVEKNLPMSLLFKRFICGPLYAALTLIFLPVAVCAIPIRCLLYMLRAPFQYSVKKNPLTQSEEDAVSSCVSGTKIRDHQFGIASANVCLLPEFLARINNISHAGERAKTVGERIVVDQFFYVKRDADLSTDCAGDQKAGAHLRAREYRGLCGGLDTHFPGLDFLCLQEVFDWNYNKILRRELHKVFPYILHDVGVTSLSSNYFLFNSGLLLASRHPVLCADFKFFPHTIAQCLFTSKGLLMVKVLVGSDKGAQRRVGYIFTTHLQAYQGSQPVIRKQLDDILAWRNEFRQRTADRRDIVLFDVLCGDFNFDNMSPGDKENREHPIFDVYQDPCRVCPGKDKEWAVGTEFKQIFMQESMATNAESLKTSLEDPVLRHRYLTDADILEHSMASLVHVKLRTDHHGNVQSFPAGGMRRIDYILADKETPVDIGRFSFVTRLASLTDHIPVAMTFHVTV